MGLCMGAWQLHPGRTSPREKHWPWPAWLGEVEENGIDVTEEISNVLPKSGINNDTVSLGRE